MLDQLVLPEKVTYIHHPYGRVVLGDLRVEIHGPTSYDNRTIRLVVGKVLEGVEVTALYGGVPLCRRDVTGESRTMWGVTQKELDSGVVERASCG